VLQIAAPVIGEMAIKVPIHVLMAHVMEYLTPAKKSRELASEVLTDHRQLARERTAQERERTAQERERTRQMQLLTGTTSQALELVSRALENSRPTDPRVQTLREIEGELTASTEREVLLKEYERELDAIPDPVMSRLLERTRGQVAEMGKPLIRSAERLEISERSIKAPLVSLNRRTVEELSGNTVDPLPTTLRGNVTRFDKENGWGKFRNPEFSAPISFIVPSVLRNSLRDDVIEMR